MKAHLSDRECFTKEECGEIAQQVISLSDQWISRTPGLFFFSLGAASYLDANEKGYGYYSTLAERLNPQLLKQFSSAYETLLSVLSEELAGEAVFVPEFAVPGFHVFLSREVLAKKAVYCHFDLQYEVVDWKQFQEVDFKRPIGFTVPILLPSCGAGLDYWNVSPKDMGEIQPMALNELSENEEKLYWPYEVGKMVIHHGLLMHQIAPLKEVVSGDVRITLQGHALFCDGKWRVYW